MRKTYAFLMLISSTLAFSAIKKEESSFEIPCGSNEAELEYQILHDTKFNTGKFALLINGSPLVDYFSEDGENYAILTKKLLDQGFKILEIKYTNASQRAKNGQRAQGFYSACLHQGLENIIHHAGKVYDKSIELLAYDPKNPEHELVSVGYSLGAVLLQSMGHTLGKKIDRMALTGVLLGDAANGCALGLKQRHWIEKVNKGLATNRDYFENEELFTGISWASFMKLAQVITTSGEGCCIEGPSEYGQCKDGNRNEYTAQLNVENQKFFTASKVGIFEGKITKIHAFYDDVKSAANPGQVEYIERMRRLHGASTELHFYEECGHPVIGCDESSVDDIFKFLTSTAASLP